MRSDDGATFGSIVISYSCIAVGCNEPSLLQSPRSYSARPHFQRRRPRRHSSGSARPASSMRPPPACAYYHPFGCYGCPAPYYAPAGIAVGGWGWGGPCWGCGPFSHDRRFFDRDARFFRNGRFFDRDGRFFHDGRFSRAGLGGPGFARGGFGGPGMMRGGFGGGRR